MHIFVYPAAQAYPPSLWLGSSGLYQASASRPIPLYVLLLDDDSSMQRIEVRFMVIITKRCQREVCVCVCMSIDRVFIGNEISSGCCHWILGNEAGDARHIADWCGRPEQAMRF